MDVRENLSWHFWSLGVAVASFLLHFNSYIIGESTWLHSIYFLNENILSNSFGSGNPDRPDLPRHQLRQ